MQGTVAPATQARISPAPPRGISRSTTPLAVMMSAADWWVVSSTMFRISGSPPAAAMPPFRAETMAQAVRWASLPLRRMQVLPDFRASAAASEVTLGRLS